TLKAGVNLGDEIQGLTGRIGLLDGVLVFPESQDVFIYGQPCKIFYGFLHLLLKPARGIPALFPFVYDTPSQILDGQRLIICLLSNLYPAILILHLCQLHEVVRGEVWEAQILRAEISMYS